MDKRTLILVDLLSKQMKDKSILSFTCIKKCISNLILTMFKT